MEKAAILVPGEKQEPPRPYNIGFEFSVGWNSNGDNLGFQHASGWLLSVLNRIIIGTYHVCRRDTQEMFWLANWTVSARKKKIWIHTLCVVIDPTLLLLPSWKAPGFRLEQNLSHLSILVFTRSLGSWNKLQIFTTCINTQKERMRQMELLLNTKWSEHTQIFKILAPGSFEQVSGFSRLRCFRSSDVRIRPKRALNVAILADLSGTQGKLKLLRRPIYVAMLKKNRNELAQYYNSVWVIIHKVRQIISKFIIFLQWKLFGYTKCSKYPIKLIRKYLNF